MKHANMLYNLLAYNSKLIFFNLINKISLGGKLQNKSIIVNKVNFLLVSIILGKLNALISRYGVWKILNYKWYNINFRDEKNGKDFLPAHIPKEVKFNPKAMG